MKVLNAIATAGGYTYRANQGYVVVNRHGQGGKALGSTPIEPDDVIEVPERLFLRGKAMRAARVTTIWSLSCRRALSLIAGAKLAGPAWADSDQARPMSVVVPPIVAEGSNQPPRAVIRIIAFGHHSRLGRAATGRQWR